MNILDLDVISFNLLSFSEFIICFSESSVSTAHVQEAEVLLAATYDKEVVFSHVSVYSSDS